MLGHRRPRALRVERHPATDETGGIDVPEHDIDVRQSRPFAAPGVAGRSGIRACALRADAQTTVHRAHQTAAARSDRDDVDGRQEHDVPVDGGRGAEQGAAVQNEADVEAGASHVGADEVAVAHLLSDPLCTNHPARGTGEQRGDRMLAGMDSGANAARSNASPASASRARG